MLKTIRSRVVLASRDINLKLREFPSVEMLSTYTPNKQTECRMFGMSGPEVAKRTELEERLREVDRRLRSGMLARGFDPAQDDNLALTAPLAKLYMERENLRAELDSLAGEET